jgi:hypothetical protein
MWHGVVMTLIWPLLMILVGVRIATWARASSSSGIYRLLRARASLLWGERADRFLLVAGALVALMGLAGLLGLW